MDNLPPPAPIQTKGVVEKSLPPENQVADEVDDAEISDPPRLKGDMNGDGRLTKEEFLAYQQEREAERPPAPVPTPSELKRLRERDASQPGLKGARTALLEKFDHDRDGAFSPSERAEAQEYLDARERARSEGGLQ